MVNSAPPPGHDVRDEFTAQTALETHDLLGLPRCNAPPRLSCVGVPYLSLSPQGGPLHPPKGFVGDERAELWARRSEAFVFGSGDTRSSDRQRLSSMEAPNGSMHVSVSHNIGAAQRFLGGVKEDRQAGVG